MRVKEGSAYPAVQRGCVECKVANGWFTTQAGQYLNGIFEKWNEEFKDNASVTGTPWLLFRNRINWHNINDKTRDENARLAAMEKYWTNPVRDLKIGRYTRNGTTYGGDSDCDKGETEACPSDVADEHVTEPAAVAESPVEAQDPIGYFEQEIVSIPCENKTATVYKTSKGVIKFERSFTFWQYVSIKESGVLDADRNQDIMSLVGDGKCDACPIVASVKDVIAAGPSTPTSDDKASKLLMQNKV
ncbi:pisatin demethylase [Metarhizium robertsii ARSEF 23]|uniref:Pisatin demethylase n=1 Tax=Metarhizium robertsii (strain ARSEF 23 / ATCC MYA-3075) TaxID=655844 RepID=A0A0B2XHZ9_METRA|nr:pisatin demethylase [Metarhizium robertsii ARSEF 23]KHO11511.1 pisatin demethylase [Metarhizium robertsii ARSEF 23]